MGLSPVVGRQALADTTASMGGLDVALRHIDGAHRILVTIGQRLGVDTKAYGEQKLPEDDPPSKRHFGAVDQSAAPAA